MPAARFPQRRSTAAGLQPRFRAARRWVEIQRVAGVDGEEQVDAHRRVLAVSTFGRRPATVRKWSDTASFTRRVMNRGSLSGDSAR